MAGPIGAGDIIAIIKLCQDTIRYIIEIKNAPREFEGSLTTLRSLCSTFEIIKDDIDTTLANADSALSSEIQRSLQNIHTEFRFLQRLFYDAKSGSNASIQGLRHRIGLFGRRWRLLNVHGAFLNHMKSIERQYNSLNLMIVVHTSQKLEAINKSIAAIKIERNERPASIGLLGAGGRPEDHVLMEYGLGSSFYIPLDLCSSLKTLHDYLRVLFHNIPGRERVEQEHYRIFTTEFNQELDNTNWDHLVRSGTVLSLAFIVGTTELYHSRICARCEVTYSEDLVWKVWRRCECGLACFTIEAGTLNFEPIDGFQFGTTRPNGLAAFNWKPGRHQPQELAAISTNFSDPHLCHVAESPKVSDNETEYVCEELYFRRVILVWDPCFNYVCRNPICRCILGMSCVGSNAPRIEFTMPYPCPKHRSERLKPHPDVHRLETGYYDDPYFDRFGGYQNFCQTAYRLHSQTISVFFVDVSGLLDSAGQYPSESNEDVFSAFGGDQRLAFEEYYRESLQYLESSWRILSLLGDSNIDSDSREAVTAWIKMQRDIYEDRDSQNPNTERDYLRARMQPGLIPKLQNGRVLFVEDKCGKDKFRHSSGLVTL